MTKFLADIPLQPKHRVVCVRMAINKNLEAQNFGIASHLIEVRRRKANAQAQLLLTRNVPDKKRLEDELTKCRTMNMEDKSFPPYTCPHCGHENIGAVQCSICSHKVKFCFKVSFLAFSPQTFRLIETKQFLQCTFCSGIVSPKAQTPTCELCKAGELVNIDKV